MALLIMAAAKQGGTAGLALVPGSDTGNGSFCLFQNLLQGVF
jgi:hypothetical protein